MKYPRHIKPAGEAVFKDRYTTKADELLKPYTPGETGEFALVGAPLSKPSISHSGASFAPGAIRSAMNGFTTYSMEQVFDLTGDIMDFGDLYMDPTDIRGNQERITEGLTDVFASNAANHWFVLGGDHSISYSSIRAFAEKFPSFGVIQFDAHHDLRNTEDGGPTNGTPFRRLLQDGVLEGKNLTQVGIRDFMNARGYHEYAESHDVTLYSMADVEEQTIKEIMQREISRLNKQVDYIYLSVDMDVLDQAFAPGCPAIGPGGMDDRTLREAISIASREANVIAMDTVEIDPTMDIRNMTSRVAAYNLLTFMKEKMMLR